MKTFLFYDIETTGLNKSFDQVLQFAAIRTDETLQELERYELKIKLNPDVIPAPKAVLTHGISVSIMKEGISEYDGIKQIHQWMNTPGTISLGYNTLGFDDEFLRFSFFRNLLPPYTHQYANQCTRMDLYPLTIMYYLFKQSILKWPESIDNKVSLKLEKINEANQLTEGKAHDAMVDVIATWRLAQLFYAEKEFWDYLVDYFDKKKDTARSDKVKHDIALLVEGFLGSELYFQAPVLYLGQHYHYKNQFVWLRLDNQDFVELDSDNIKEVTRTFNKKWGNRAFYYLIKKIIYYI